MSKAARRDRQQRQRARVAYPDAAGLADRADQAVGMVADALDENLAIFTDGGYRSTVTLAAWSAIRRDARAAGLSWPDWSWVPYSVAFNATYLEVGPTVHPGVALGDFEALVAPIVPVINWLPGRTAVRYHPDVLDTLAATPIDGRIPVQALYRLPQWGLFLDCPFLGPAAGVFASVDPGTIYEDHQPTVTSVDELMLTFVLPAADPPLLHTTVRLSEDTIAGSFAAQDAEWTTSAPAAFRALVRRDPDQISDHLGRSFPQVVATVVSMLLYLCVEEPDLAHRPLPLLEGEGPAGRRGGGEVDVVEAGWRLGAALQDARARYQRESDDPTGRHVTPHLRRAHWHTYWAGPRSDPDARRLVLHYLAPIPVGRDSTSALTVVRDAPPPPASPA